MSTQLRFTPPNVIPTLQFVNTDGNTVTIKDFEYGLERFKEIFKEHGRGKFSRKRGIYQVFHTGRYRVLVSWHRKDPKADELCLIARNWKEGPPPPDDKILKRAKKYYRIVRRLREQTFAALERRIPKDHPLRAKVLKDAQRDLDALPAERVGKKKR